MIISSIASGQLPTLNSKLKNEYNIGMQLRNIIVTRNESTCRQITRHVSCENGTKTDAPLNVITPTVQKIPEYANTITITKVACPMNLIVEVKVVVKFCNI